MNLMPTGVLDSPRSPAFARCSSGSGEACSFEATAIRSGEHWVVRCPACGLGATLPPIEDVSSLYADRQSWDFQPSTGGLAAAIKRIAFRRHARALLAMVPGRARDIIDYGCGSGLLTSCIADVSDARVHALDFHEDPPAELAGPSYLPFSRAEELAGTGDVLIASHVLEHEIDPVALVSRMARLVKPGGYLVFEVPNVDCFGAWFFGRYWDAWYLPFHRLHFNRRTLRAVVERAGLTVVAETGGRVPTMGRTAANLVKRRNNLFFLLLGAALHPVQLAMEVLTRQPSALRIACRKPE